MRHEQTLAWLDRLLAVEVPVIAEGHALPGRPPTRTGLFAESGRTGNSARLRLNVQQASAWFTEAHACIDAGFPPRFAVTLRWKALDARISGMPHLLTETGVFEEARGILSAARGVLLSGHAQSFSQVVRTETISEVLDQADAHANAAECAAAMVLAGGALETHLRGLCETHQLSWAGDGSISKYDGAIAAARNAGTVEIYSASDTKLVTAWGGVRNDAAHDPTRFRRSPEDVRAIVGLIRGFVARTQ